MKGCGESPRAGGALHPQGMAGAVLAHTREAVVGTDAEGRIVCWNRAAEVLYGLSAEGVMGRPVREAYTCIWPEDDEALGGDAPTPHVHVRRDGQEVLVESTLVALQREDGALAGTLTIMRNVRERVDAEQALRESEQRHRQLLESLNEGIWALDKDGNTTFVNSRMPEMLGYAAEEMIGKHLFSFMDEEGRQIARRQLDQQAQGVREDHDFEFIRKDGSRMYARLAASPLTDEEGHYAGAIAGIIDITRRRRMEQALRRTRDRLEQRVARRTAELREANEALMAEIAERQQAEAELRGTRDLLEQVFASLNLLIAYLDTDFNFVRVNHAYARADGQTPEFFVGKNHFELYPHAENEAIFREVVRTGRPYATYAKPFTYPSHPERGVTYWDWTLQPVKDASGRMTGIVLCLKDVTEQKKAEQALRANEQQLRHIYDNSPVMMHSMDEGGVLASVNKRWLEGMGYASEEAVGRPVETFMTPESARRARSEVMPRLWRQGRVRNVPYQDVRKDGSVIDVLVDAEVTTDPSGRRISLSVVRNITRQKEAERKLRSYQEQLRSLAAQLSLAEERERRSIASDLHDGIGQALTVAGIKLGALRRMLSDHEAVSSVDQVRQLVEQIMRDTRSLTFDLSPPVLYELGLEAALEWLAEQTSRRHGIPTEFHDDRRPKPLHEDVGVLLFRATRELLINVAKHAHASRARLSVSRDDARIRVEVRDDGVGFDVEQVTAHNTQAGFGLFSIRERLDHVGGRLEANSRPGDGSTLALLAPLISTGEH